MPIFEYHCDKCGAMIEILVRGSEVAKPICPKCGGSDLKRSFSVFSAAGGRSAGGSTAECSRFT